MFQFPPKLSVIRKLLTDQVPEGLGMVELGEVAEFVDDDVVGEAGRKEGELVAEIEVAMPGATAPSGLLVADSNFVIFESVELVEVFQAFMDQLAGRFFMGQIFFSIPLTPDHSSSAPEYKESHNNPAIACLNLSRENLSA